MRERRVPRFIIAPDGLGKSVLACEYAETVFSFNHVFWIDCRSPCFFREIDEQVLGDKIIQKDEQVRLVVFDGLVLLDEVRAESFVECVEKLLGHMSEVVVTLQPSSDVYGRRFLDRLCFDAWDMLLSDAELEISRVMARRTGELSGRFALPGPDESIAERRIACMTWGKDAGDILLSALAKEQLLTEVIAWMFGALVVRSARIKDIPFLPRLESDDLDYIAEHYPFFGLNASEGEFLTVGIDVAIVSKAFSAHFDRIAAAMRFEDIEELHNAIASHLLVQGRDAEACRYIQSAGTRAVKERWLAANGRGLFLRGVLSASSELFAALRPKRCSTGLEVCMVHAWRLYLFDECEEARRLSARVLSSPYSEESTRIFAALLLSCHGADDERAKADVSLLSLLGLKEAFPLLGGTSRRAGKERMRLERAQLFERLHDMCAHEDAPVENTARLLACMRLALRNAAQRAGELWHVWQGAGASENALIIGAVWVMQDCPDSVDAEMQAFVRQHLTKRFGAVDGMGAGAAAGAVDLDVIALCAFNALRASINLKGLRAMFGTDTTDAAQQAHALLACQQRDFRRARASEARCDKDEMRGVLRTNLGVGPTKLEMARSNIPPLSVKLFGGLEVSIGNRVVEESEFRRKKCMTMLAMLVLAEGRDVRSTTLMEQMWPASSVTCARRSLYTVWSQLKKTLSLADGSCPYLSKRQGGYRMETRYVISDVARANELCRAMDTQRDHVQKSQDLLLEFNELYSRKLLPNEIDNETIVRMRDEYQRRFVDVLVSTATALGREGRVDDALCFATCAFETDHSREDVYLTLMRAQYQAGQRVQAMKTYMECRDFLSEELGIDPSEDINRMYLSFLEDDQVFA